ncbi:MAG: UDP-N-acetylmuramate dehydrogenase [Oscillospiraceae bacterium]|nr:UDP-N-acetylmuramate dehydrogenase [Oscillospiraceae bacterium]
MIKTFLKDNQIQFLQNESLKKHITFKVGGEAKFVAMPQTKHQAANLIKFLKENNIKYYIIGRGSNVIFRDEGFDGVIIKTSNMQNIEFIGEDKVYADSGVVLNVLCKTLQEKSLAGLEFCYGIPGNVGGGLFMNCGAYGGEISSAVCEVEYIDENGNFQKIDVKDCQFSYRHSIFQDNNWFITGCTFKLTKGDKTQILSFMEDIMQRRIDKQPLDKPSAGSSFKRPVGYFAAALIDECGLKGYSIGGAQVSEKHAGFIVNTGNATCNDIVALAEYVEQTVMQKKGVAIEKEMIIV